MIGLIAATSMALGMAAAPATFAVGAPGAPSSDASAPGADLKAGPAAEVFQAIELHYPDEYRQMVDALERGPGADGAAGKALQARLMADFYRRRAEGLRRAPPEMLIRLNAMQLGLIKRLAREDVALCADFATSAFAGRVDLPAPYQREASALGALIVEASKLGEGRPRDDQTDALAENDAFTWYSQLLHEEPSTEFDIARAGAGSGEVAQANELECRVGLASFGALARLPPEQAANVGASLLAQILAEPARD